MATLEQIAEAIKRADAAGNADDVKSLGAAYRALQAQGGGVKKLTGTVGKKSQGGMSPNIEDRRPQPERNLLGSAAATAIGLADLPIVGPAVFGMSDALVGLGGMAMGQDFNETVERQRRNRDTLREQYPIANMAGQVGGAVAGTGALAATKAGAEALGMTGKLVPRIINSATSGAAISAADTAMRGGDIGDIAASGGLGGAISGAIPVVGQGLKSGIGAIGRVLQPTVGAVANSSDEALRRTGMAVTRDAQANPAGIFNASDEAVAQQTGVPIINADRGGETVRALTRSVANQSPEARAVIEKTASDRFGTQAGRAVEVVRRLAGGAVDDLAYQDTIKRMAQSVNDPAYKAAYSAPGAQAVWNQPIKELMQSDTFRAAISAAEKRGSDKAAVAGFKAVKNPFEFLPDGNVTLKTNPDGSRALPSLQFWDQVKRNIDGMIGTARKAGDETLVGDLTAIKRKLTGALDSAVPEYATARSGAAAFFGAEDALDAGKIFANQTRQVPEATRAFNAMKPAEKDAFRTGFASEIIDKIKDGRFRSNIIDGAFGSPAKREMIELVFGKAKARELEAYIRVEDLADKLRGAMGNSTTARQLMELGIGAGSGALLTGGDWKGALTGAAFAKGARYLGQRVDDKVMQEVARLLMSNDPALISKAVNQASMSPMWMDALEAWGKMLAVPSRGVAQEMMSGNSQPLEITVGGQ